MGAIRRLRDVFRVREAPAPDDTDDAPDLRVDCADGALRATVVFDLLSNRRRIQVVELVRHEGHMTLGDLARTIAAVEEDVDPPDVNKQQRKRVYISLYQTHLPKLADADVIEYDDRSGDVFVGPTLGEVTAVLDRA